MREWKVDAEDDCPNCGAEDEELAWLDCCGLYRCYNCWARHEEKWGDHSE